MVQLSFCWSSTHVLLGYWATFCGGVTPMPIFVAATAGTLTPTGAICTRSANALTTSATPTPSIFNYKNVDHKVLYALIFIIAYQHDLSSSFHNVDLINKSVTNTYLSKLICKTFVLLYTSQFLLQSQISSFLTNLFIYKFPTPHRL